MSQRLRRAGPSQAKRRSNENDPYEPSQSLSQLSQTQTILTPEEETKLVGTVIRYLLAVDRSKNAVHRSQIIKNAFGTYGKQYRKVMAVVKLTMLEVFGFKLEDLEGGKCIIVNTIPNDKPHLEFAPQEQARQILLFFVLAHVFMSDNLCREELLWNFLTHLGIIQDDNMQNGYFGDIKKLITTDFIKQQYLDKSKIGNTDPPKFEYKWGARADEELSKRDVLEFVSKMFDDRPINTWPTQFRAVESAENLDRYQEHGDG